MFQMARMNERDVCLRDFFDFFEEETNNEWMEENHTSLETLMSIHDPTN